MKKFLALVLALVMTMSLVTISAGAEDFTDDASITYEEAVDVMTAVGVVGGYADGSFNPKAGLTRGAAAKIICNMLLGPTTAEALACTEAPFADVAVDNVFAGYIAYCANEGIISGYADGTFKPAAPLTGYAFMKMLLGALGYDADIEGYTGANWSIQVAKRALNLKLNKGLEGSFVGSKALTREEACLYAFNTLKTSMVKYDTKSTITIGDVVIAQNSDASSEDMPLFRSEYFEKLVPVSSQTVNADDYGRPAHAWKYDKKMVGTYTDAPVVVYTEKFTKEDLVDAVEAAGYEFAKTGTAYAWVNAASSGNYSASNFAALADTYEFSAAGTVREFYGAENADGDYVINKCVIIETTLDQVTAIAKDKASTKADDRSFTLDTNGVVKFEDEVIANFDEIYAEIEEDDYVLVTKNTAGNVETVEIPEMITGKVTKVASGKATIDGSVYVVSANGAAAVSTDAQNVWLDTYGNVMKTEAVDSSSDVVYFVDTFKTTDKFNVATWFVRVVTADGEVVELKTDGEFTSDGSKMFTYTIDADGYAVLTLATNAYMMPTGELKATAVKADSKYFADEVVFIYVDGVGSDLKVSVKDGVQAMTVVEARYVLDTETSEIVAVFVTGGAGAAAAEDLIFAKDGTADGDKIDDKGVRGDAYAFYINGEAMTEIVSGLGEGLYTYTIDAETGRYTATVETNSAKGTMTNDTIVKDKYVTVGETCVDYVLDADCVIYDLSNNGLTTLAEIDDMVEEGVTLKIAVAFDTDDKVITTLYVY